MRKQILIFLEKEAMRILIKRAIEGLEMSERRHDDYFTLNENDKQVQVNFETITDEYKK